MEDSFQTLPQQYKVMLLAYNDLPQESEVKKKIARHSKLTTNLVLKKIASEEYMIFHDPRDFDL